MEEFLRGKTILITGGTGFLGRNLAREMLKYGPASIRLFSRDEVKHYKMKNEFPGKEAQMRSFVGDIRDYERLKRATRGCDIIVHAAALKRVDMIEYNVDEAIKTNIIGTMNIVRAAFENEVEKVVFVSSDKACSPINTYGACKFVGERIFIESNFSKGLTKPTFFCVRYGNVIESTGSVIPFFIEKIRRGESIPLTSPEMTRFFITPKQAVETIFNAIKYGDGGEIFVPKLPSFKMIDLVDYLKNKYEQGIGGIGTEIVGIRPGEKIHEVLINSSEADRTYDMGDFFVITSQIQKYRTVIDYYKYLQGKEKVKFEEYSSKSVLVQGDMVGQKLTELGI